MFGYVQYEKPHLYIKDFELYKAAYCGVCKGIGASCGQLARTGLSYDATFLNIIFHNLKNCDLTIKKNGCVTKFGAKRLMAEVDELTELTACVNTVWLYYKLSDDVVDEKKGGLKRAFFTPSLKKARKKYPMIEEIVKRNMTLQQRREDENCDSLDIASDATGMMLQEISDVALQEFANEHTKNLFYALGKWIYLIDAVDDYDKDVKKSAYNPFVLTYGEKSKEDLIKNHEEELNFLFGNIFYTIRESMSNLQFYFNRDLIDNVLLLGLPAKTKAIFTAKKGQEKKDEPRKL